MNNINFLYIQEICNTLNGELDSEIKKKLNGSTLDEKTLLLLSRLTEIMSPRVILEFGSGTSTSLFASYLKKDRDSRLISLDNFKYFADKAIEGLDVQQQITSIHAPISLSFYKGCPLVTYSNKFVTTLKMHPKAELVLIDGPYGRIFWRDPALVLSAPYLHKNAIILLDDSARAREQKSLAVLEDLFNSQIEICELPGFSKGLTLIRLNGTLPKSYPFSVILHRYLEFPRTFFLYRKYKKLLKSYIL